MRLQRKERLIRVSEDKKRAYLQLAQCPGCLFANGEAVKKQKRHQASTRSPRRIHLREEHKKMAYRRCGVLIARCRDCSREVKLRYFFCCFFSANYDLLLGVYGLYFSEEFLKNINSRSQSPSRFWNIAGKNTVSSRSRSVCRTWSTTAPLRASTTSSSAPSSAAEGLRRPAENTNEQYPGPVSGHHII